MAETEHIRILRQGVAEWNNWRRANPDIVPDLSEAGLQGANLSGANLQRANLQGANLLGVELVVADLRKASIRRTLFSSRAALNGLLYPLSEEQLAGAIFGEDEFFKQATATPFTPRVTIQCKQDKDWTPLQLGQILVAIQSAYNRIHFVMTEPGESRDEVFKTALRSPCYREPEHEIRVKVHQSGLKIVLDYFQAHPEVAVVAATGASAALVGFMPKLITAVGQCFKDISVGVLNIAKARTEFRKDTDRRAKSESRSSLPAVRTRADVTAEEKNNTIEQLKSDLRLLKRLGSHFGKGTYLGDNPKQTIELAKAWVYVLLELNKLDMPLDVTIGEEPDDAKLAPDTQPKAQPQPVSKPKPKAQRKRK